MASRNHSSAGVGKLTLLVFFVLIGSVGFCAYNILPFYYYYYDLQNQFRQVISVASTETDKEIRDKLMYYIKKYEIPIGRPEDLKIEREGNRMRIGLKYQEVFYIRWQGKDYDLRTFDFNVFAEGTF